LFQKELDERYGDKVQKKALKNSPFKNYKQNLKHFASNNIPQSYTKSLKKDKNAMKGFYTK